MLYDPDMLKAAAADILQNPANLEPRRIGPDAHLRLIDDDDWQAMALPPIARIIYLIEHFEACGVDSLDESVGLIDAYIRLDRLVGSAAHRLGLTRANDTSAPMAQAVA